MPPEDRVLYLAAGGRETDDAIARILEAGVRWDLLRALAIRERASARLRERIVDLGYAFPPEEEGRLRTSAMFEEFRQHRLMKRARECTDALVAAGIPVILLKGAAVAHTAYDQIHRRPMGDVDLLVPEERGDEAQSIAMGLGWTTAAIAGPEEAYDDHHHLSPLEDSDDPSLKLELHTELLVPGHPYRFGPADVVPRSRPLPAFGPTARSLDPLDQVLHICLHFAWCHRMEKGAWLTFRDLVVLLGSEECAPDRLLERIGEVGARPECYWTLRLARSLAHAPVPDELLTALEPSLPRWILGLLERHYLLGMPVEAPRCPSRTLRRGAWAVGMGHHRSLEWLKPGWRSENLFGRSAEEGDRGGGREKATRRLDPSRLLTRLFRRIRGWAAYLRGLVGA